MQLIAPLFFVNLFLVLMTLFAAVSPDFTPGCFILGSELNGDGSIEHLMIGNCL